MICKICGCSVTSFVPFWVVDQEGYENGEIFCTEECLDIELKEVVEDASSC